jgi:ABC-type transport system involved in Fe-S cluster assembly fused permease/ATPase subunit
MCEMHSFWQQELLQNSSQLSSSSTIPLSATGTATFANLATIKNKVAKITRGGITRDIDRGTQSVSTLLSIFVFNILPSFFAIILQFHTL